MNISIERLEALRQNINDRQMGVAFKNIMTLAEEDEIRNNWVRLPGTYSMYDTINWMIRTQREKEKKGNG